MGLLDGLPNDWLDVFRNSALKQNLNAGVGAETANTPLPLSLAPPTQPPPLSLAGPGVAAGDASASPAAVPLPRPRPAGAPISSGSTPDAPPASPPPTQPDSPGIGDRLSAGFQSWARTPLGNPWLGLANGVQGLATGQRADAEGQRQALFAQAARPGAAGNRAAGGIDYDRLQRNLLASGDLDGAKTVSDIAGRNSTELIRNYAYARSQGFPGSILDYGKATRAAATRAGTANANGPRAAPPPGSIQSGYRFRGGNPADPNNWEQVP
jgi:hypothetical protein